MATINQLVKQKRTKKQHKIKLKALEGCPFKRGICIKVLTAKPKKPNSAIRKIAKVLLSNKRRITVAIPGEGHPLQEYSNILVRGGRANDLPGVKYKAVKGKLDFSILGYDAPKRNQRRSKFGIKKDIYK